ncbi:hypothetical protein [Pseudarthrobacter cellobiosi]|nr:hypothetical protein [Pseudarthrobacter sp. HLT1-5]
MATMRCSGDGNMVVHVHRSAEAGYEVHDLDLDKANLGVRTLGMLLSAER